ncbi:MAG: pyridoxine 5'-phosphate synthase [Sphingomonadales bacterium]|nr:pyridoxine 5'-phosphate synthase [Sphingomonadales bacterium]
MSVRLSVNINKAATLRNSRGGNNPDVFQVALDCIRFGAESITVHPRPDERHIRRSDVQALAPALSVEFNMEGNPKERSFTELVLLVKPAQVTLVPDGSQQLTSDHGWDVVREHAYLTDTVAMFREAGIRTSLFVDPNPVMVEAAIRTGTHRIELYTESYARLYPHNPEMALKPYVEAAEVAVAGQLGLNAGHDLSLQNLSTLVERVPGLLEVSIGHALFCDALYFGLENTIHMYLRAILRATSAS